MTRRYRIQRRCDIETRSSDFVSMPRAPRYHRGIKYRSDLDQEARGRSGSLEDLPFLGHSEPLGVRESWIPSSKTGAAFQEAGPRRLRSRVEGCASGPGLPSTHLPSPSSSPSGSQAGENAGAGECHVQAPWTLNRSHSEVTKPRASRPSSSDARMKRSEPAGPTGAKSPIS